NIDIESDDNDDDDDDGQDHEGPDDDNKHTDSDNDGDDFVHPKFSTHDEEDKEYKEEDRFDPRVQTPSHYESIDDEESNEVTHGANVEGEELDKEAKNKEDEANELYRDSSSVSSGFVSNMFNPSPDTCIDSIFNLNTESTSLVDVPVTTIAEPPLSSATTLPSPTIPLITHLQQTPAPTPTTVPTNEPICYSSFLIPGIVDAYLANKMHEVVKTVVQLQSDRLRDEVQAKNEDFINKLDDNIKKIIKDKVKEQVKAQVSKILLKNEKTVNEQLEVEVLTRSSNKSKTSHVVAANLSELELKKILIDKMENIVSFKRRQDNKDKDKEPSTRSNRGSKRRRAGKEPESTSAPKEKTSKTTGKSTEGSKSHHKSTDEFARDVYSKRRIVTVTKLQIVKWHNYKHLDWITVRRDDNKLYKFKEGDFNRLYIQDIEYMLLLLVQGKLTNLTVEERLAFNNKDKKNRLMRIDELHKFWDGTLNDVRTDLNDRLKGIQMNSRPEGLCRAWRNLLVGDHTRETFDCCKLPYDLSYDVLIITDTLVMRTASAAAKPSQGDSLEFYLITGSTYIDQRGTVVLPTIGAADF
ncbi:hypothetical protein Tco_0620427, partial [Tanacetum coccineum]